jgi:hypothetical protein
MYSGEYDACDVTLSVYPHRASLKNMPQPNENCKGKFDAHAGRNVTGMRKSFSFPQQRFNGGCDGVTTESDNNSQDVW